MIVKIIFSFVNIFSGLFIINFVYSIGVNIITKPLKI